MISNVLIDLLIILTFHHYPSLCRYIYHGNAQCDIHKYIKLALKNLSQMKADVKRAV
jgi:hypothetical protein